MIITKQYNAPQAARLYEHLFAMTLERLFYDESLFPHVDYAFHAHKLQPGGMVCVDTALYTNSAKALANKITALKIQLDDKSVNAAIAQLIAEEERQLGMPDTEALRKELRDTEALPWQDIDDVDAIDPKRLNLRHGALYIPQNAEKAPARKLNINFGLDQ